MDLTRSIMIIMEDGQFTLPVNPKQLSITREQNNKSIELLNIGTVSFPGKKGVLKVDISTFLPNIASPFFQAGSKNAEWILSKMEKHKNGQKAIRLIISDTDINRMFLIGSMSDSYIEGDTDIQISWSFLEYTELVVAPVASLSKRDSGSGVELCTRSSVPSIPKSITVKKGDSYWAIGKRYYDDGTMGDKIAKHNRRDSKKILQIGTVLELPR